VTLGFRNGTKRKKKSVRLQIFQLSHGIALHVPGMVKASLSLFLKKKFVD